MTHHEDETLRQEGNLISGSSVLHYSNVEYCHVEALGKDGTFDLGN